MVTEQDVRQVAELARLRIDEARLAALVTELNQILSHMDALSQVPQSDERVEAVPGTAMPLRADAGPAIPLFFPREQFAPSTRDGFFQVPRLHTHEAEDEDA